MRHTCGEPDEVVRRSWVAVPPPFPGHMWTQHGCFAYKANPDAHDQASENDRLSFMGGGIYLDFVKLTTRTEGPHGAHGRTCGEPEKIELSPVHRIFYHCFQATMYATMAGQIKANRDHVSASVYTQTTDLERECDGCVRGTLRSRV